MAKGGRKANQATVEDDTATSPNNTENLPPPFEPVSTKLLPFARTLPRDHVFVVHLEKTPPSTRRQAFYVPVAINLIITIGLCWRSYYAVPTYLELLITILGYETKWTVDQSARSTSDLLGIIARRTVLLLIDYGIFGLLGRWPWEFLFGDSYGRYTGMFGWRWGVGFNEKEEIIVRRGRKWDKPLYVPEPVRKAHGRPDYNWSKQEELVVHGRCSEALKKTTTSKTALALLDQYWDLDYRAMLDAIELVRGEKVPLEALDHVVIAPWNGRAYSWYPHKNSGADAIFEDQGKAAQTLKNFKLRLTDIDCEDVFYRWIEIVQYETSLASGFTAARKQEAEQEFRRLIKARGKDDDSLFKAVGGTAGIPGLADEG